MKKILAAMVLSVFSMVAYAQTFVCTDMNFYGRDWSSQKIQREKERGLGSKAVLTFYDNSLRLAWTDRKGETVNLILSKIKDDDYIIRETKIGKTQMMNIKLQKWVGYIKSFSVSVYENQRLIGSATFKRH